MPQNMPSKCCQSLFQKWPNARGKRRRSAKRGGYKTAKRFYVRLTELLGWRQVLEKASLRQPENLCRRFVWDL